MLMADVNDLREKAEAAAKADTPWTDAVSVGLFYAQQHALRWHPGITIAALQVIEAAEALQAQIAEIDTATWDDLSDEFVAASRAHAAALRDFREAK